MTRHFRSLLRGVLPERRTRHLKALSNASLFCLLTLLMPVRGDEAKRETPTAVTPIQPDVSVSQPVNPPDPSLDIEPHANDVLDDSKAAQKLAPDRFREVDRAASLLVWLVICCGLGGVALLLLIVFGARRMRRLTRSQVLKSKYDELEYLRLKHRREVERYSSTDATKADNS